MFWGGASGGVYNNGASYCSCVTWYADADGDGWGDAGNPLESCDGVRPNGYLSWTGDCNDGNPAVYPGAADNTCNGVNEDCDAETDEDYLVQPSACGQGVCRGFGSMDCINGQIVNSCVPGTPSASTDTSCNNLDDDCDGPVDEDFYPYIDHWEPMPSAPSARTNYTALHTGREVVFFGGDNGSGMVQNGGVGWNPNTNTWRTLPAGPAKRWRHTMVWADTRMIVWGGDDRAATLYNSGSRFDPFTDTWAATTTTGAPSARSGHVAVWSGSRMVVWGGRDLMSS